MNRKHFNKVLASVLGTAFIPKGIFANDEIHYPFQSLSDAFNALGFRPRRKGSAFFVVTADVHYGSTGAYGMNDTIREVNAMDPAPSFFCVNGDLIVNGSKSFGVIPDPVARASAIKEFNDFKSDAMMLNAQVPLKLTLGNHDTHPEEIDPELFWEVFPGYPPYQSFQVADSHVILLNGHSTGFIDPVQLAWLMNDVSKLLPKKNVIVFVHQPSMSRTVRERGIPEAICKVFGDHQGLVWLIGGHEHTNSQRLFRLSNTHLIEHHITCGAANIWGGPEKPGYWIYCLEDGKVVGRIFRQRTKGYRLEPFPDLSKAVKVPMPFSNVEGIVWVSMVEKEDRRFIERSSAADCLNYFAYVKELVYRIPSKEIRSPIKQVALLTDHREDNRRKPGQYFISMDKENWSEVHPGEVAQEVIMFAVDAAFQEADELYFRFTPSGEAAVAGIAALSS